MNQRAIGMHLSRTLAVRGPRSEVCKEGCIIRARRFGTAADLRLPTSSLLLAVLLLFLANFSSLVAAQETLDDLEEQALRSAVEAASPSVVQIETVGGLERVGKLLVGT